MDLSNYFSPILAGTGLAEVHGFLINEFHFYFNAFNIPNFIKIFKIKCQLKTPIFLVASNNL